MELANKARLLSRLKYCLSSKQRISFLVGSAISASPQKPNRGVPTVDEMIDSIYPHFSDPNETNDLRQALDSATPTAKYQAAMRFFLETRGQGALNDLVRKSVLKARITPGQSSVEEDLERDIDGWTLAPGAEAIGRLVANYPQSFVSPLLTTNFDPLLEISIRKSGRDASSVIVPADGNFFNGGIGSSGAQVVHLHGFWRTGDMLHTPTQLTRHRPSLKGALRTLLRESTLVVTAYGGWEDVFTRTLIELIAEGSDTLDVLWCCYEEDPESVMMKNKELFNTCENLLGQRLIVYSGIDCHKFFPDLAESLGCSRVTSAPTAEAIPDEVNLLPNSVPPPAKSFWVGRNTEIATLDRIENGVVCICGFGGVGKSTLAAKMLEKKLEFGRYSHWAWIDCRELDYTIGTHLLDLIQATSGGNRPIQASETEIVEQLVDFLTKYRAMIVFDNVDAYVDLESGEFVGTLKVFVNACCARHMQSQVILTCRPQIEQSGGQITGLNLHGLNSDEITELIALRTSDAHSAERSMIEMITEATGGNALYVNLLITQVMEGRTSLEAIYERLKQRGSANIQFSVLEDIWQSLTDKQRQVSRFLCESPGPQLFDRLEFFLQESMTPNRVRRTIRSLVKMDVVTERTGISGGIYLEMHPLVRNYIKNKFTSEERKPFILRIVHVCDLMIKRLRSRLTESPEGIYEYWSSKIELSTERGDSRESIVTLLELVSPLSDSGYIEEFVRLASLVASRFGFDVEDSVKQSWDKVFEKLVSALAYLGREGEVKHWLNCLHQSIEGKSARYVFLKELSAEADWVSGRPDAAVLHAREGVEIKDKTGVDTDFDCKHILALSLRDSGSFQDALDIFLGGHQLDSLLGDSPPDESSHFFGNIGRTLQLQGNHSEAKKLLRRSAQMLLNEKGNIAEINRGWAAFWLAQILEIEGDPLNGFCASAAAFERWKGCFPRMSREAQQLAGKLRELVGDHVFVPTSTREIIALYDGWCCSTNV